MDAKQLKKLLAQAGGLSPDQFKQLVQAYTNSGGLDAGRVCDSAVYSIAEQKLAALGVNRACTVCRSIAVERNGTNAVGIQRLHCQDCGKNFTHFTETFLEKSRFP